MYKRLTLLGFVALLFVIQGTTAYTQSGSPLANREHPRIWLTRSSIPTMQAKLANDNRSEYQSMIDRLNGRMNKSPIDGWDRYDMLNYAFVYAVGPVGGINYGGQAIEAYGARARTLLNWFTAQGVSQNVQPEIACAYDWIFPLLSPSERAAAVDVMVRGIAAGMYDDANSNDWMVGVMRNRAKGAIAGLAFAGDGVDDAAANTLINTWYLNKIQGPDGFMESNNFTGSDGTWMMGMSYSVADSGGPAMLFVPMALEAWRTANNLSRSAVFGNANTGFVKNWSQWFLYHTTPFGVADSSLPNGRRHMMYVDHASDNAKAAGYYMSGVSSLTLTALAGLYKTVDPNAAGLAQWVMNNRAGAPRPGDGERYGVFAQFIAGERGVAPRSPSDLGLPSTKYFPGFGWVVMRDGFSDPGAAQVTFIANKWMTAPGNYDRFNSGSFTIDRNGPLAINAGQGIHSASRDRTWSHNTMIFPDPNETVGSRGGWWDKGGQRRLYSDVKRKRDLVAGGGHDLVGIKRILSAGSSPNQDFDYIFSDQTKAYNGDGPSYTDGYNTAKVRNFTRQFIYFRPENSSDTDRIIVFDRTQTTDTRFEKRWLLHTSGNPQIDGAESRVRDGKWKYTGGNVVTQTNTAGGSNGKLFSTTLLPAAHTIYKVGGPDSSGNWLTSGSHEFEDPYGVNDIDQANYNQSDAQWVGQYRIEVVPTNPSLNDNFLHVLEAGDASVSSRTPTVLLNGTGVVGARVGDKIAVFSTTEAVLTSGELIIDQPGSYWVLLCDLRPGLEYTFSSSVAMTASSAGTIYLEVSVAGANSRLSFRSGTLAPPAAPRDVRMNP